MNYDSVTVIIPTMKGREDMLKRLLSTIPDKCGRVVVDDENLLLAAKRNKGAKQAIGEFLLFIDDDNYLKPGSIDKMVERFDETIGVMGMTACYHDRKMIVSDGGSDRNMLTGFTSGIRTNWTLHEGWPGPTYINRVSTDTCYRVDEVANAFMIRRSVFEDLGGLDEVNFPIDLDEADFCKRAKDAGYKIVMNPLAICYHNSQTYTPIPNFRRPMNAFFLTRNKILYQRIHTGKLQFVAYLFLFLPVHVVFYVASLLYKKNPRMIPHLMKGVLSGIRNRLENPYQKR